MSFDILQDKIRAKKNPLAAGLGAGPDDIPPHILNRQIARHGETLEAAAGAALDGMELAGLVGSLAGDDTVILIMRTSQVAEELTREIESMLEE